RSTPCALQGYRAMSAQGKHRDLPLRVAEVECHRVTRVVIDNFTVGADFHVRSGQPRRVAPTGDRG
ncbi:MAG TPA: hypothetical protein PKZ33_03035, partial [Brevefilum sp.]|nr:hypothetical protein [Brevefilum sp.]